MSCSGPPFVVREVAAAVSVVTVSSNPDSVYGSSSGRTAGVELLVATAFVTSWSKSPGRGAVKGTFDVTPMGSVSLDASSSSAPSPSSVPPLLGTVLGPLTGGSSLA